MPISCRILLTSILISVFPSLQAKVNYSISIEQPAHHLANITMEVPAGLSTVEVKLPNWRTGKYELIHPANGIRAFSAETFDGQPLAWKRKDKSSWQIDNPSQQAVKLYYQLYANELGQRTRHIDQTHAFLDATAVLLYENTLVNEVHSVSLSVPTDWKSYSGMVRTAPHAFIAQNYDQLADSPIETGLNQAFTFSEDGRDYEVVFWGESNREPTKIVADLQKMVSSTQKIWTGYPYQYYLFIIHATQSATGATEHVNSTIIQRPRLGFAKRSTYLDRFLRTAAHEIVHTWNVKAYRPASLVPYDYQQENYSDLLWMAEGGTSYFQDRLLLQSELQSIDEFLEELSKRIDEFEHKPGRLIQSVSDSSFEKWIAQSGHFAENFSVNIYSEGFMASWLLDFKMLNDSTGKQGLASLHNRLYLLEPRQPHQFTVNPYEKETILNLLQEITGQNYQDWWQQNIESPLVLDFDDLLKQVGLKRAQTKEKDFQNWLGIEFDKNRSTIVIQQVEKDSPAWQANLTIEDEILAIDGIKVTAENVDEWLKKYQPGDQLMITLFRNDKLDQKKITLGKTLKKPRKIQLVDTPSEQQKAMFNAWLGINYPAQLKSTEESDKN